MCRLKQRAPAALALYKHLGVTAIEKRAARDLAVTRCDRSAPSGRSWVGVLTCVFVSKVFFSRLRFVLSFALLLRAFASYFRFAVSFRCFVSLPIPFQLCCKTLAARRLTRHGP